MTEPTNEQIERAARDAGLDWSAATVNLNSSAMISRSILAHARTIAEAEAREAAAEQRGHIAGMREAAGIAEALAEKKLAQAQKRRVKGSTNAGNVHQQGRGAKSAAQAIRHHLSRNPDNPRK